MTGPVEPSDFEGTVYRDGSDWAFKICRSGYEELVEQCGLATRQDAYAECRRQLDGYDPGARVINQYKFRATIELLVEGDSLEEAREIADQEFAQISDELDDVWWSRKGPSRYGIGMIRERYEE